jgi:hypothetical protein
LVRTLSVTEEVAALLTSRRCFKEVKSNETPEYDAFPIPSGRSSNSPRCRRRWAQILPN